MRSLFGICLGLFGLTSLAMAGSQIPEWTMLVYLNGNNSLDSFGPMNINQMETVGSTDKMNVVVQWASLASKDTKRLLVQKDSDLNSVTSPVVQTLTGVDMGSPQSLKDFILWGMKNYPAKHYFVNVWNHGGGWHYSSLAKKLSSRDYLHVNDISWDDNTGNSISTEQLGQVMKDVAASSGQAIDIYGSDACLMAMVEVAAEMQGAVNYFVGSQETEPGAGWPYDKFMNRIDAASDLSAKSVATILTEEYTASYQGGSNGSEEVTFSAVDMSKLDPLMKALTGLAVEIKNAPTASIPSLTEAAGKALRFYYSDYADLSDLVAGLKIVAGKVISDRSLADVQKALSDYVVVSKNTTNYAKASGVSIWAPNDKGTFSSYQSRYGAMSFNKASSWLDAAAVLASKDDSSGGGDGGDGGDGEGKFVR